MTTFELYHPQVKRTLTIGTRGFKHDNFNDAGHPLPDSIVFAEDLYHVENWITSYNMSCRPAYAFKYNGDQELGFNSRDKAEQARIMLSNMIGSNKKAIDNMLGI